MIVPLYLWIPGECNDFVVMFSGMDEWVNEYEWMKKKIGQQANKQTNKTSVWGHVLYIWYCSAWI